MPTTITETIGSGGDFTTPALWEAALPANLVTADEIRVGEQLNEEFSGSGNQLTIAGQTTDATRYVVYTAAAGASFADNANKLTNELRYNASNGAGIRGTSYYSTAVVVTTDYTRITRLQIHASGGAGVVGHGTYGELPRNLPAGAPHRRDGRPHAPRPPVIHRIHSDLGIPTACGQLWGDSHRCNFSSTST